MMSKRSSLSQYILPALTLIAIGLWVAWAWYVIARFPDNAPISAQAQQAAAFRGQFGDMFGGINALFTAIILAGAVYTVWLQHRELEALKEQQDDSRKEGARLARLQAYSALVNAQGSLLNIRYQMAKDLQQKLESADPHTEVSYALFMSVQGNYQLAGKAMVDLESLSTELASAIEEIKSQNEDNTA